MRAPRRARGTAAQHDLQLGTRLHCRYRKCDKPLLVIHCEDDQIVPIGPTGRRVPSVVPHAILKVYEGGAYGIAIIDPERVNADFLAFIKGEMKK